MKLCGVFGYTDAGKTTFIEHLSNKETQKYKLETKKGITLKVGYLDYVTEHKDLVYILDNPGHLSLSIETLRNIDIIDFGIYVLDASNDFSLENQKNKLLLTHYSNMVSIFKTFNTPFILILNKIDQCSEENLLTLYKKIRARSTVEHIVPTCSLNPEVLNFAKSKVSTFVNQLPVLDLKKDHLGLGRVIKSFDINPVGVELPVVKGGVLGVYFFNPSKQVGSQIYVSERQDKNWVKLNIVNCRSPEENTSCKIGTLETQSDPYWFKNDSKKSCFICTKEDLCKYTPLEPTFHIKLTKKLLNLNKGDELLFIYEGQSFNGTIRKMAKNNIECVRKPADAQVYKISSTGPILMFTKNDMKEYAFSGTGVFHEET